LHCQDACIIFDACIYAGFLPLCKHRDFGDASMTDEITGKAKGGIARAKSLSPIERKEIAQRAAAARWDRAFSATHKGNFEEEFGINAECYVLNDAQKSAVISQSGMAKAIGLYPTGNAFPRFMASKGMVDTAGADIADKIAKPIKFQWGSGGAGQPPTTINGYDVTILIDVCKAIAKAHSQNNLTKNQESVARQAGIILAASAKSGIKQLVYALAGYNPSAEEVIAAFKMYVQEEAKKYEREFPNELYMQWHRLYEIPVPVRGKPWHFKHLTVKHIYFPLAKSNGKIYELIKALKASGGDRQKKMFQFLNDLGARALRIQIGRVLEMSESSKDKLTYESKITERFGGQQELDLVMPEILPETTC
jgi:hypothetical protein